jgi:hypothetical protein
VFWILGFRRQSYRFIAHRIHFPFRWFSGLTLWEYVLILFS